MLPIEQGLLVVRRAIEPRKGQLALPGGFIELGESWQAAAVRELREETAIIAPPEAITLFAVHSAPDGTVLIFGCLPPAPATVLSAFQPGPESSELVVLSRPEPLAFPLHTRAAQKFFQT